MDYEGGCSVRAKKTGEEFGRYQVSLHEEREGPVFTSWRGTLDVDELMAIRLTQHHELELVLDDGRTSAFVITSTKTGGIELLGAPR